MSEQQCTVIVERTQRPFASEGPERVIYHLPDGPSEDDAWFQPVKCGGGIALHGHRETVPRSQVCPDCLGGRTTL